MYLYISNSWIANGCVNILAAQLRDFHKLGLFPLYWDFDSFGELLLPCKSYVGDTVEFNIQPQKTNLRKGPKKYHSEYIGCRCQLNQIYRALNWETLKHF